MAHLAQTKVLIVGAGPTGLATAMSLAKHGFRDFVIVEAVETRSVASRAMAIHAATVEALDSVGCAEMLINAGIKGNGMELRDRRRVFVSGDFSSLRSYTRFPFVLLISQYDTERILEAELKRMDIPVQRGKKAVGIKNTDDTLEVTFENGDVIKADYVVAADGAHSVIRSMAGIKFEDPDGPDTPPDPMLRQIIFADVTFSSDHPLLPKSKIMGTASSKKFFLIIPLPMSSQASKPVYRIGFNASGTPPPNPPLDFLQQHLDTQGPLQLSSSNPDSPRIENVVWSTRFRTHAAVAEKFLIHIDTDKRSDGSGRGQIILVGDAAHIHAPAGGLGMNLGIRDAISLGPVLIGHIKQTEKSPGYDGSILTDYAASRKHRALTTIRFTKKIMGVVNALGYTLIFNLNYWIFWLLGSLPYVRNRLIWNLSGLGNK